MHPKNAAQKLKNKMKIKAGGGEDIKSRNAAREDKNNLTPETIALSWWGKNLFYYGYNRHMKDKLIITIVPVFNLKNRRSYGLIAI